MNLRTDTSTLLDWIHDQVYAALVDHGNEVSAGLSTETAEITAIRKTQALCKKLQEDLGGREHYLPALSKNERHRKVAADLQAGLPPDEVAQKHGLHPRTVKKIADSNRQQQGDDPGLGTPDWML